ncbi:MAG: HAD family hydrolase [Bdellovibrionales bacterium]
MTKIAIFDFDGTLARHDSLLPFLLAAAGWPRCLMAAVLSSPAFLFAPQGADRRTRFKEAWLKRSLKGLNPSTLGAAVDRMRRWPQWMASAQALREHHAQGHHILIATGSLDLYIREMLGDLPYDGILATEMEVKDGLLTGEMASGNCTRDRKAERVKAYLQSHGPFEESWAYGNAPHDLPMMALTTHKVII